MKTGNRTAVDRIGRWAQGLATLGLGAAALAALGTVALSAAGVLPWLTLPLTFGDVTYPAAGIAVQCGLALLLLFIAFLVPSGHRVMALERTHRDFRICMSDVADAYRACHAADRGGVFQLSEQYDAVKERLLYLRKHPDLGHLEFDVLEAAAQMSSVSHELAETYSDEKVARARSLLAERQAEIERFQDQIAEANTVAHELRRWQEAIGVDEDILRSQLDRLQDQLGDVLQPLGFSRQRPRGNVVSYPHATAAE